MMPTVPQAPPESRGWCTTQNPDCCSYTCGQGHNCPVRAQRRLAPAISSAFIAPANAHHIDHRAGDAAPFWFSTPADLNAQAGPEPMIPAHDIERIILWVFCAITVVAVASIGVGMYWPQISASLFVLGRVFGG